MTYAPPPYAAPVQTADPTNVMGRRIMSHLVDLVIVVAVVAVLFFATAQKTTGVPSDFCTSSQFSAQRVHSCVVIGTTAYRTDGGGTGFGVLIVLGYWIIVGMIEGATGAFLGKRLFGLRVVSGDGSRAGAGRGALRGFLMVVDSMLCFVIGLITALATHPHRRVGDMAAGTYVVGKDSVGRPVAPHTAYSAPPVYTGQYAPPPANTAWGAPPAADVETPTDNPTAAGWAAPAPETQPAGTQWRPPPAPQNAPPPPVQDPTEPHWDAARNAWIAWEPTRGQWMQFDGTTNQWRPM